jgi:hypothetical protein
MAMIRVQCPKSNCRTITEVDEIYLGRTARCRKCGTSFEIRRPDQEPKSRPTATTATAAQAEPAPFETPATESPPVNETPAPEYPLAVREPISQELASVPKTLSEVPAPILIEEAVVHTRSRTTSSPEPPPPPASSRIEEAVSDTTRKRQRRTRKSKSTETPEETQTREDIP